VMHAGCSRAGWGRQATPRAGRALFFSSLLLLWVILVSGIPLRPFSALVPFFALKKRCAFSLPGSRVFSSIRADQVPIGSRRETIQRSGRAFCGQNWGGRLRTLSHERGPRPQRSLSISVTWKVKNRVRRRLWPSLRCGKGHDRSDPSDRKGQVWAGRLRGSPKPRTVSIVSQRPESTR